jgi:hypothetical protein
MATAEKQGISLRVESLNALHWIGIAGALVSAGVHLLLGVRMFPSGLGISFILAGIGFLGGIALVLVDVRRRIVYAAGLPFTIAQIVLWYFVNFSGEGKSFPGDIGTLGAIDKIAQVVLVAMLVVLLRTEA